MIVKEKGFYRLLEELKTSNSGAIGTLPKGTIIEVTQISEDYRQVISPDLLDWTYWELPVEKLEIYEQ